MKKKLTLNQFQAAIKSLEMGSQTQAIAKGVLVEGLPQTHFVKKMGVTKGAVSQTVKRVWDAHKTIAPKGFEVVTATLPKHQALIVKKWEKEATSK